jgi:hypothetical protein
LFYRSVCRCTSLLFRTKEGTTVVLAGIALTAILSPVIFPEMEPPPRHSFRGWMLRSIGKRFAEICGTGAVISVAAVCSVLGDFWIYGYAGIAAILALGRSVWIRMQGAKVPKVAIPSIHRLVLIFAVVFAWAAYVLDSANSGMHAEKLSQIYWQKEFSELYRDSLEGAVIGYLLAGRGWTG